MGLNRFEQRIREVLGNGLMSLGIETVQVNLGLRCNQHCRHCHVNAGPDRTEQMDWPTMERVVAVARLAGCARVDLTGGAPELNEHFRRFVEALAAAEVGIQVRTNLTVHLEPGIEDVAAFLRGHHVALVASLPCYLAENVDTQRGADTYRRSVEVLGKLNALGYGVRDDLPLNLIYNPLGPSLPPEQASLEVDYRRELLDRFGIRFHRLLTITNMPIGRFLDELVRTRQDTAYMDALVAAFNADTLDGLMCRRQISVGFDGMLYDCDFNLALGVPIDHGAPDRLCEFDPAALSARRIETGDYCFGCTAGFGSSCGGALA